MQWLDFIRLNMRRKDRLSEQERQQFAELDQKDEQIGNAIAAWEWPALIVIGGATILITGVLLYGC